MSVEELKAAIAALSPEERKTLILETLPDMTREAMDDPAFAMQLFPAFIGVLKEKGLDLQQLMQMAAMFGNQSS